MEKRITYYRFDIYPIKPIANPMPKSLAVDIYGNSYIVTDNFKFKKLLDSPLKQKESILNFTFNEYRLFYAITKNRIKHTYGNSK